MGDPTRKKNVSKHSTPEKFGSAVRCSMINTQQCIGIDLTEGQITVVECEVFFG